MPHGIRYGACAVCEVPRTLSFVKDARTNQYRWICDDCAGRSSSPWSPVELAKIDREQATIFEQECGPRLKSDRAPLRNGALHTILVVEDDDDIRESVCEILEAEGYRTLQASNGLDALNVLRQEQTPPCLILLDLMMPVMDGWQFCECLTRDRTLPPIPLLVMTAHGGDTKMGAIRQLRKPLHPDQLLSAVEETCVESA
jgi:CheY-like chemotaxis protein